MHLKSSFDYESLNPENRRVIKERTQELKERLQRTAQDIWEIGLKLCEVRARLEHGQFEAWIEAEFGWSRRTAYNFIKVYETFPENAKFAQIDIDPSALYLLASPSTPQAIRDEFIQKASTGTKVTHKDIREAVSKQKLKSLPSEKSEQQAKQSAQKQAATVQTPETDIEVKYVVTEVQQSQAPTSFTINSSRYSQQYWYMLEEQHLLFWGDTNSQEFINRSPFAALAVGVAAREWNYEWLTKKAKATIILDREKILDEKLIKQLLLMFSHREEAIIFPWLPSGEIIALVHRLGRRMYTGDTNLERCKQAIAKSGLRALWVDLLRK